MRRVWRVHHPDLSGGKGAEIELGEAEARHVRTVLRLQIGEAIAVFDGDGREWLAELIETARRRVSLRLDEPREDPVEPPLRLTLFQSLCRNDRVDWVVQKATEVGVSVVRLLPATSGATRRPREAQLRRWQRIALEACKQSGRRRLPTVDTCDELPEPPDRVLPLILDPGPSSPPLGRQLGAESPREAWVAVGPEGGFTSEQLAAWVALGWQPAALGPRTLRTETAGLVAASILLHRWGDLGV